MSVSTELSDYRAANDAYRAALAKHAKTHPMPMELVTAISQRLAAAMRLADAVDRSEP